AVLAVPEPLVEQAKGTPGAAAWVRAVPPNHPQGSPEMLARTLGAGWALRLDGSRVLGNTLVMPLERLVALAPCLAQGRAHVEKIVTVSVAGTDQRRNLRVRIGTPIADLLAHLEIPAPVGGKLILGGPLCGDAAYSLEQPVTAGTDALLVQPAEAVTPYHDSACTNCGLCNAVCPVDLQVNLLGRYAEYGFYEKCRELVVDNCIECGLCAYVCPARRPLVQYFRQAKSVLRKEREEAMEQA
ncbi:MAG: 4Fe-4S dicluster domain-containing protein, partial [Candidatus Eisenbacteria bacterium]|nr:4Fe-4S dicluster domain-containing protein [Candidatus Eisenbacteria bacterium]